jgi:tetratricopeptide (TPR) repeat protein
VLHKAQNYNFFFIYQKKIVPLQQIMRKLYLFIALCFCTTTLLAQSADKLFQSGEYELAMEKYGKQLESTPGHALATYRYGRCAYELKDYDTALEYLLQSPDKYTEKFFYLGELHLRNWNVDAALEAYDTYIASASIPEEKVAYIERQIEYAEKLQRYLLRVERLAMLDSVTVPKEMMLETCLLSAEAGQLQYDSIAGIDYINQRGDYKLWSQVVNDEQVLCFSHRLLDTWTTPETLPSTVNFTSQQLSPYLMGDGVTLYFAAMDSNGLGGLDIYVTRYNTVTEQYTKPDNVGMPYNSPANEYMLILDEMQQVGYIATDRSAPEGYVTIYSFVIPKYKQYWKDIAPDSIVAYAQFRHMEWASEEEQTNVPTQAINKPTRSNNSIHFVLNDSVIYTSMDDFVSSDAYLIYAEWEAQQLQLTNEQEQLKQLRDQYLEAEPAKQRELAPIILKLEKNQTILRKESQKLLLEIRQIEMSAQ